ncbi:alpha/beta fold hydrolase [Neobacillus muris]|uniref:alpha/beta fold hydrolase n=1 Tax=Neobacillus muris TaxID=2941334 RepID=UPI00203E1125|nr:alpha/beta hydrolase [Neobacillus muris]
MKTIYRKRGSETLFKEAYEKTLYEWDIPFKISYVQTRFGKTHVIEGGFHHKETLLLFHGFGFSSTMWKDNIHDLSQHYHVFALDFIGDVNMSEATKQVESKQDCADWFRDVLNELQIEKTHILGMSYGGFLACVFATLVPEKIDKVITVSPGATLLKQRRTFFFKSLLAGLFPTARYINKFMDYMCSEGNQVNQTLKDQFVVAMQNCMPRVKVFASYLTDEELRKIHHSTLLIVGRDEVQYDPNKAVERAKSLISSLEVVCITNAGHGVLLEQPEQVNRYILDFLND